MGDQFITRFVLLRFQITGVRERVAVEALSGTQARDAGFPVIPQITLSAVFFAVALNRRAWIGFPGASGFLGRRRPNRSLSPAIASHAAIDMIVESGMMLMAAVAGAVHQ